MVSPMREKRAWPPRDKDADGETVAAFEATVAVVKETVVRSGEVLVSAKEDLSDHQRWLKAQTAAVEAGRERHERWLQRQRERQEALERREQKRARRRAMRQAGVQAVKNVVLSAVLAVRSAIWSVASRIVAGLNFIDHQAWRALVWVATSLRNLALSTFHAIQRTLLYVGHAAQAALFYVVQAAQAALFYVVQAAQAAFLSLRRATVVGASRIAAKAQASAPALTNSTSIAFGGLAARTRDASRSARRGLAAAASFAAAKAATVTQTATETLTPLARRVSTEVYARTPALWDGVGRAGVAVRRHAGEGAARAQAFLPSIKAPRVRLQNAVSLPAWARGIDLSQMLIIAGALLLVCGGLMLGGGLMLRAGTPSKVVAEASPAESLGWYFEHKDLPLAERSIFISSVTPQGVRIKGFSIGGENISDKQVSSLSGVIKPDVHGQELKLELIVEKPGDTDVTVASPEPAVAIPPDTVAPEGPFKFVFRFPGAEDNEGMTPQEVITGSGGLLLKVHYEVDGKEKTFIQYLPSTLLEEQLSELAAEAKGS
jgi:hypothetical protein